MFSPARGRSAQQCTQLPSTCVQLGLHCETWRHPQHTGNARSVVVDMRDDCIRKYFPLLGAQACNGTECHQAGVFLLCQIITHDSYNTRTACVCLAAQPLTSSMHGRQPDPDTPSLTKVTDCRLFASCIEERGVSELPSTSATRACAAQVRASTPERSHEIYGVEVRPAACPLRCLLPCKSVPGPLWTFCRLSAPSAVEHLSCSQALETCVRCPHIERPRLCPSQ